MLTLTDDEDTYTVTEVTTEEGRTVIETTGPTIEVDWRDKKPYDHHLSRAEPSRVEEVCRGDDTGTLEGFVAWLSASNWVDCVRVRKDKQPLLHYLFDRLEADDWSLKVKRRLGVPRRVSWALRVDDKKVGTSVVRLEDGEVDGGLVGCYDRAYSDQLDERLGRLLEAVQAALEDPHVQTDLTVQTVEDMLYYLFDDEDVQLDLTGELTIVDNKAIISLDNGTAISMDRAAIQRLPTEVFDGLG